MVRTKYQLYYFEVIIVIITIIIKLLFNSLVELYVPVLLWPNYYSKKLLDIIQWRQGLHLF